MISPQFVLRGFPSEPAACCGFTEGNKSYLNVGLSDGFIELWSLATYRKTYRSQNCIFTSKSPTLCIKHLANTCNIVAESKIHEFEIFKVDTKGECLVHLGSVKVPINKISPTFCQFDYLPVGILIQSGQDSGIVVSSRDSKFGLLSEHVIEPSPSFGKSGSPMFVKFLSTETKVRVVCGFENGLILLWSLDAEVLSHNLLDSFTLSSLLDEKSKEIDDSDICPSCADALPPSGDSSKPAFVMIGTVSNTLYRLKFNNDLTSFKASLTRVPSRGMTALKLRSDRKLAVCGFGDGSICLISPKSLSILGTLTHHCQEISKSISAIDFVSVAANFQLLIASCRDKTVSIWNIYN